MSTELALVLIKKKKEERSKPPNKNNNHKKGFREQAQILSVNTEICEPLLPCKYLHCYDTCIKLLKLILK